MKIQLNHSSCIWVASQIYGKNAIIPVEWQTISSKLPPNLSVFVKIFENIIFNKIYDFLLEERLSNPNQSKKFESPCDNVQKDIFLYGDSRLDRSKNEVIFVTTVTYIKNSEIFSGSPFEEIFLNE